MRKVNHNRIRNNRGVSIIVLAIVFAMLLLTIDFFLFNVANIFMVERQIEGACEAASLAGTSILAKLDIANDNPDHKKLSAAQKAACRCAENMLLREHILGSILTKATPVTELSELGTQIKPEASQYFICPADPETNCTPVNFGDPRGKTISCYLAYGYRPVVLSFLASAYAVSGNCVSGLPQIDSVLVLDLSASMDDQTVVTFVRREWINTPLGAGSFAAGTVSPSNPNSSGCGIIQYVSLNCPSSPHTLANYLSWDYNIAGGIGDENTEVLDGLLTNVLPPQNLDKASNESHGAIRHPMYFDAYLRSHYSCYDGAINYRPWEAAASPYCRAMDFATPPGNCDLSVGMGGNGDAETDMSGNLVFGPHGNNGAMPQINAFSDTTWQNDHNNNFAYQPAAPGCTNGLLLNDPIPSPDQQTFTDLVVNIGNPASLKSNKMPDQYQQPLYGPDYFVGFSYTFPNDEADPLLRNQTFNFPNIAVVVEAARGNLENTSVLPSGLKNAQLALIDRPVSIDGTIFDMRSVELKDGYQRAYQRLAMLYTQPLASVLAALDQDYLQKLHKLADCHFGLVSFSSKGSIGAESNNHLHTFGTLSDQSINPDNSRSFYVFSAPYGDAKFSNPTYDSGFSTMSGLNNTPIKDGSGFGFRVPRISLDIKLENYLECVSKNKFSDSQTNNCLNLGSGANGIYNCRVLSLTDTGEALASARNMFHSSNYNLANASSCRKSASKAIILFTDGEPTGGINGQEAQYALEIAGKGTGGQFNDTCERDGITVFTIGLNLAKGKAFYKLKDHQLILLGDNKPAEGQSGGIAWRAGHRGKYYSCEDLHQLKLAMNDIARRFTQSQR